MQVGEHMLNCVGFIGADCPDSFIADGTCFFVSIEFENESFIYSVTARHLVRPRKIGGGDALPLDGTVQIRLSRTTKPPIVIQTNRSDWICHSDEHIDLCVYPFDLRKWDPDDEIDLGVLNLGGPNPIVAVGHPSPIDHVALADDVFITSLFTGHPGHLRNIPIIRVGNVAALPIENIRVGSPRRPAYLIETRSLGGTSGAPVFVHLDPGYRSRIPKQPPAKDPVTGAISNPFFLIGMVLGAHSGDYSSDFTTNEESAPVVSKDSDFNAGISVVLPIEVVMELIDGQQLKSEREAAVMAIQKESGYRHSSARASAPEASKPDNPDHREAFTDLVRKASKTKPQAD